MSVKERIISIRLIEMIYRNTEYAEEMGITGKMIKLENVDRTRADAKQLLGLVANKRIVMNGEED